MFARGERENGKARKARLDREDGDRRKGFGVLVNVKVTVDKN